MNKESSIQRMRRRTEEAKQCGHDEQHKPKISLKLFVHPQQS